MGNLPDWRCVAEERSSEELADAVIYGELAVPGWDVEFEQLRARINLVCVASPDLGFPPLNEAGMRDFLIGVFDAVEEIAAVNLRAALLRFVGKERFHWLAEITPTSWRVGGAVIAIAYSAETDPGEGVAFSPVARVQESLLDSVDDHPFVCEGHVALGLQLLDGEGGLLGETLDWSGYRSAK